MKKYKKSSEIYEKEEIEEPKPVEEMKKSKNIIKICTTITKV